MLRYSEMGDGKMSKENKYDSLSSINFTNSKTGEVELNSQVMELFNIYRAKIEILEGILLEHNLITEKQLDSLYKNRIQLINEETGIDDIKKKQISQINELK